MNITTFGKTDEEKIENRKAKQKKLKQIFGVLAAVILILSIAVVYSQYKLYTLMQAQKEGTSEFSHTLPKTKDEILKSLSRHVLLPEGVPQVAEVQDATKLRGTQTFFKAAENGDIVIVYSTSVFIYRPSKDIIIAFGDISGSGQIKP
jgi:hypothetical protein